MSRAAGNAYGLRSWSLPSFGASPWLSLATPFKPMPIPSITWLRRIPFERAIMTASDKAKPKAQFTFGVPSQMKLPTAMVMSRTSGARNWN